jgi:hypothetical protein
MEKEEAFLTTHILQLGDLKWTVAPFPISFFFNCLKLKEEDLEVDRLDFRNVEIWRNLANRIRTIDKIQIELNNGKALHQCN